jgi:hypothetical protein
VNYLSGLALNYDPLDLTSQVARITDTSHWYPSSVFLTNKGTPKSVLIYNQALMIKRNDILRIS